MPVPNQTSYIIYNANGLTTVFPFEFYIINSGDIQVSLNGEVITTGYSVSGVGNVGGGDVMFLTPPANGTVVMLERVVPTYRLTDYQDNGDLLADTVNKDFDRLWMAIQRSFTYLGLALRRPLFGGPFDAEGFRIEKLGDPVNQQDAATKKYVDNIALSRVLRVPESYVDVLPAVGQRASKLLAFNNAGKPIAVLPQSGSASDVLIELAKPTGAGMIVASDGHTVEEKIHYHNIQVETVSELQTSNYPIGTKITVLGYYERGDIPPFNCIIQSAETDEDFGSIFSTPIGFALRTSKFNTLDIRYFGAVSGNASKTTRAFNNIMLYTQKSEYRTIFVPNGVWTVDSVAHEIKVDDFTLAGEHGSIIHINNGFLLGAYPYAVGGYRQNFSVSGIKFIGLSGTGITCFDMSMVQGVTIKGCVFEECLNNGHILDAIGCRDVDISDNKVVGSNLASQSNKYAEAFQFAEADPEGQSWRHPEYDAFFDGRSSSRVSIKRCRFVPKYNTDGSIKSYPPRPAGGHSPGAKAAIDGFVMQDCYIDKVTPYTPGVPRTEAVSAINLFVSGRVIISDCVYIGHGSSSVRSRPFLSISYKPEYIDTTGCQVFIERITIPNSGEAVTDSEILISTLTGSSAITRNIVINVTNCTLASVIGTQPQLLVQVNNTTNPITGVRLNVKDCSLKLSRYIAFTTEVQEVHVIDCVAIDGSTQSVNAQCSIISGLFAIVQGCSLTRSGFTDTRGYLRTSLSNNVWDSENSQGGTFRRCIISNGASFSSVGNRVYGPLGASTEYGIFQADGTKQTTVDYEFSVKS